MRFAQCYFNNKFTAILIILTIQHFVKLKADENNNNEKEEVGRIWQKRFADTRKTADDLGVPECKSNFDCVVGGVCIKDHGGKGRCFCSSTCPLNVPVQCIENNQHGCVSMGDSYTSKYDMRNPLCYHKRCICPPQFDPNLVLPPASGFKTRLPHKCDKRELNAVLAASPSDSIYKGMVAYLFCCINVDPRGFIPEDGVFFLQNGTRHRDATSTPYENFSSDIDSLFSVPTCWILAINNVQPSDAGTYQCLVQPANIRYRIVNASLEFAVKTNTQKRVRHVELNDWRNQTQTSPRMIQNITILPNMTSVVISWDTQDGPALKIDMDLFKRSDRRMRAGWKMNVKSPVSFDQLSPATPYTLFIKVTEGQNEPFLFTEQFFTSDGLPEPPVLEDIRLVSADNGKGQMCEVEWRPPTNPRGLITRYYVQISGRMRYISPDSKFAPIDHYPPGVDVCSNYEQDPDQFINPTHFHSFFACKYGQLKPNRNYQATVWAENRAGRSKAASFNGQCVMDFAEPEHIDPPETLSRTNISSFALRFGQEPDQGNGPIACYYLAIIPLPVNVSIEELPSPESIVMDTFDKALQNNLLQSAITNKRFFAYIAESYIQFPKQTVIGDGNPSGGVDPCNVLYLIRYKANDPALTPELKYTGFLIARVDRDKTLQQSGDSPTPPTPSSSAQSPLKSNRRLARRQLTNLDPAYGYSDYFKPVILQLNDGMSAVELFFICLFLLLFLVLSVSTVAYFLHKRGMIKQFCPVKKRSHDLLRGTVPPAPLPAAELPAEYVLKHRDSDYQFTQEFEMLPRGKNLDHTISERKENGRKNRYNDIKACDATRVRLKRIPGDPTSSDYINANFIKGYKGKKMFIATQGPLECTTPDFWRMVWEQGSRLVIMVTNLRERGREQCAKYWPDEDESPLNFRTLEIAPLDSAYYADYTVRQFELSDLEQQLPPITAKSDPGGRASLGGASSSNGHNSPPPALDGRGAANANGPSPTPPNAAISPLMRTSHHQKANSMNCSAYSIHSQASNHDYDRHSSMSPSAGGMHSTNNNRPRPDSEYANISSIIRPQSKCSERASVAEANKEKRRVVQFHFTSWNDYKAPECTISLLRLLCKLRKMDEYNRWPVVVHCSAGVGRTGTLVAIDYVLDQMIDTGMADVFGCVTEMRQQRNLMVQSVEQYVFIYKALAEYQLFGETDLTVPEFRKHFQRLSQPLQTNQRERHFSIGSTRSSSTVHHFGSNNVGGDEQNQRQRTASNATKGGDSIGAVLRAKLRHIREGSDVSSSTTTGGPHSISNGIGHNQQQLQRARTQLELEFQDLSITLEKPKPTDWAHKEENVPKNRFADAVPCNFNRVILQPMIGYDNTYYNASLIKGYFYPYILAQDPLDPETAFEFWRMVNDQQTYTIVMLSTEQDFLPHEMYWPREVSKRLVLGKNNELTITLAEELVQSGFVQRKLHYRFKQSEKGSSTSSGRDVLQYAFRQWKSGTPVPNSASALLDLIGRVLERQSNIPDAGPIILHCRDGSAENGIFCCLSLLLERLRSEQMIDVFRTVKALQLQRPLLFTKIEQYAFCYECVTEYLNSTCR